VWGRGGEGGGRIMGVGEEVCAGEAGVVGREVWRGGVGGLVVRGVIVWGVGGCGRGRRRGGEYVG